MALQVWLPLNGNLENRGVMGDITITSLGLESVDGKIGSGYKFDNGTGTGRGISLNTNFVGKLGTQNSIAVWVKPYGNHVHYNGTIISSGNWNSSCWAFGLSQDNSSVDVFGDYYSQYISCPVPVNQWTHLACVNDNGTCKVYKNGTYIGSRTNANLYRSDASNTCIGRETYASGYFGFNGAIQDVRIYDHCLSQAEVKEISKGLVLHYPLNEAYVEPTTNIAGIGNASGWNNSGTSQINSNDTTIPNIPCKDSKVYSILQTTAGQSAITFGTSKTNVPSKTLTISTWFYMSGEHTSGNSIGPYIRSTKSDGSLGSLEYNGNSSWKTWPNNTWIRISKTITTPSDATTVYFCAYSGALNEKFAFNGWQIEEKDHATPYTPSSRNETTVYDCSGYGNNGTVTTTSNIKVSQNSSRYDKSYEFDGVNSSIQIPVNEVIKDNTFTMNVWIYKDGTWGSKGWETIFGGPSGFEYQSKRSATNSPSLVAYSWGQSSSGGQTYEINKWNMVTMVRTSSDCKFYLNGNLYYTGSAGSIPAGNYFIGAWSTATGQNYKGLMSDFRLYSTTLSASDIQELYNTGAKISKNGTLMCYELKED